MEDAPSDIIYLYNGVDLFCMVSLLWAAVQQQQAIIEDLLNNYAPITEKIVTEQVAIPFETITKEATGNGTETRNKVLQEGKEGIKEITYKIKYQSDVEIEKIVISEIVLQEPVNKIIQVQKINTR